MDEGSRRMGRRMAVASGVVTSGAAAMAIVGAFTQGTTRVALIGAGIALGVGASAFGGVLIALMVRARSPVDGSAGAAGDNTRPPPPGTVP